MAVTETTPYVSYIQDSNQANHPIAAPYLVLNHASETPTYVPADNISGGVKYVVGNVPDTLTEDMIGTIYLVADSSDVESGSYIEYLVFKDGNTIKSEAIGTTKINVSVSSVSTAKDTVGVTYLKADDATGSAGGATVQGSNFSFSGTTATISVPKHSHTIGGTTKYLKAVSSIPKTFSSTSVVSSLTTTTVVSAGSATNVVTGYASPTKAALATTSITYNTDAIKSYPGSFAKIATTSIYPAADVTALTSVTGTTTLVYPAANVTALTSVTRSTTSIYPAANVTAITSVTGSTATLASRVGSNVMNGATVSNDGILSFSSTAVSGNVVSSVTTSGQSVRGSSITVVNAVTIGSGSSVRGSGITVVASLSVPNGKSVRDSAATVATGSTVATSSSGGAQIMIGLGTATAATKATTTVATGGTATGTQFLTGLGTASTTSVASAGSEITVVTGADGTANAYTGIASSVNAVDVTTTASGNTAFISTLDANTGEKAAESISYRPEGTIGGSQSISAHTHSIGNTSTSATVSVTGHTHTITLSGGQVN